MRWRSKAVSMQFAKGKALDDVMMLRHWYFASRAQEMIGMICRQRRIETSLQLVDDSVCGAQTLRWVIDSHRPPPPFSSPTSDTQGPSIGLPHRLLQHRLPFNSW